MYQDVVVVVCGGNDLGGEMAPELLVDTLVDRYKYSARVVVFCNETVRDSSKNSRVPTDYPELLRRFNERLRTRCAEAAHLIRWRHMNIGPRQLRSDGVHLNDGGQFRLFLSLRSAINHAVKVLDSLS